MITTRYPLLPRIDDISIIEVDEEATSKFLACDDVFSLLLIVHCGRPSNITEKYEEVIDTHIAMKNIVNIYKNKMD